MKFAAPVICPKGHALETRHGFFSDLPGQKTRWRRTISLPAGLADAGVASAPKRITKIEDSRSASQNRSDPICSVGVTYFTFATNQVIFLMNFRNPQWGYEKNKN